MRLATKLYCKYSAGANERSNEEMRQAFVSYLNKPCILESKESAFLGDGAEAFGRDVQGDALFELWDKDGLFLEIRIASDGAARIELRSTSAVGISSAVQ